MTGVRIPSTAMTSNTALPLPQSSAHAGTFQSVFEGASQQSASAHVPVDPHTKPQTLENPAGSGTSGQGEAQLATGPGTDSRVNAAGSVGGERWQAIAAEPFVLTASPDLSANVDQPPVLPIQANLYGTALPVDLAITKLESDTDAKVSSPDANPPAGASASSRVSSKLEKPKATSASNDAGLLATVAVVVVDQKSLPIQHVLSGQGTGREQGDGSSGSSAKPVAANDLKGTHVTQAEPLAVAPAGESDAKSILQGPQLFDATLAAQVPGENSIVATYIPLAYAATSNVQASLPVGKATPKGAFDGISSIHSDPPALLDVGKSVASGSADAVPSSAQSVGPALQGSQVDPGKSATVTARATESGVPQLQAQTVAMHVTAHDTGAAQHVPTSVGDTVRAAKSQDVPASIHTAGDEPVASSGINAAKLIQSMGGSEMRVGMHSAEFGDISIRTTISQQQMVAQISLSHNDLTQAILAHVATVQAKLGEDYSLHASIEINNQGSSLSGEAQHSSQQDQRSLAGSNRGTGVAVPVVVDSVMVMGAMTNVGKGYGLDIRV
jgi:hypothetical protein